MKAILFLVFLFALNVKTWAHNDHNSHEVFSMQSYLEQCGGKIYADCDSEDINQISIYEEARRVAIANQQQILIIIGADWCPPCRFLDEMIKEDEQKILVSNYVVVEINGDVDSARQLAGDLDISYRGYPSAFLMTVGTSRADDEVQKQFMPSMFTTVEALVDFLGDGAPQEPALVNYLDQIQNLGSATVSLLKSPIEPDEGYGRALFFAAPQTPGEELINYGFAALNVFHYADAFRAFWTANQREPSVYAKVGLIISSFQNDRYEGSKVAQGFLAELVALENISAREKAWIEFAKTYYSYEAPMGGFEGLGESLSRSDMFALLESEDGQNPEVYSSVRWLFDVSDIAVYEKALTLQADNVGAHHYIMHIYEGQNRVAEARQKGLVIKDLAPLSAHAVHMYGHTLPQIGKWEEAIEQFIKADDLHIAWSRKNGVSLFADWHYSHNMDLLASAALVLGQQELAQQAWSSISHVDYGAWFKALQLSCITVPQNDILKLMQIVRYLEEGIAASPSWSEYLTPLLQEVKLNKSNQAELVNELQVQAVSGTYAEVLYLVVAAQTEAQQSNPLITDYFINRMKEGGFDGWSHSYLELLRLKRVALILEKTTTVEKIDDLQNKILEGLLPE